MACKHCGATSDLIPKDDGTPSSVCRPCRRAQINVRRSGERAAPRYRVIAPSSKRTISLGERKAAFDRAHQRALDEGIPMVEALKAEGVI